MTQSPADVTEVYTDGACRGNPGPGGWAWAVKDGPEGSGGDPATTNQRMEVRAAYEAVQTLEGPLCVVSDSTYVVNCFRQGWWKGWHKRGWRNSAKQPVANRDLWEPFVDLVVARGNPGPGGWAWAVKDGPEGSGGDPATTNQRMEVRAAYEAVQTLEGPLCVVSDSTYVVNCFRQGWWKGWHKRGWRNSAKQPVANRDLWEPFVDLVVARGDVEFRWVKGHSGHPMNDLVDKLAVAASHTQPDRAPVAPPAPVEDDAGLW